MIAHGNGEWDLPVHQGLQDMPCRGFRRLPEDNIPRMDHEIGLLRVQHLDDIPERTLGTFVSFDIMGIREL